MVKINVFTFSNVSTHQYMNFRVTHSLLIYFEFTLQI